MIQERDFEIYVFSSKLIICENIDKASPTFILTHYRPYYFID